MRQFFILIFFCSPLLLQAARPDSLRYQFAKTYFGIGTTVYSQGSTSVLSNGSWGKVTLPHFSEVRLEIGGLHFWNHADFYLSFPLYNTPLGKQAPANADYSDGVLLGGRYFLRRLSPNRPDLYAGMVWCPISYIQANAAGRYGVTLNGQRYALEGGLSYALRKSFFSLNARFLPQRNIAYATDKDHFSIVGLPAWAFSLSYRKVFDFTAANGSPRAQRYLQGLEQFMNEKGMLSGLALCIGPSGAFGLGLNEFYTRGRPFLNPRLPGALYPDMALAYYFAKPNLSLSLSYRPITIGQAAYGFNDKVSIRRIALELSWFKGDFHGFDPFIGPSLSLDYWHIQDWEQDELLLDKHFQLLRPGVVAGWDIRPEKTDFIVLRTNLRYYPDMGKRVEGYRFNLSQMEFNFIQVVLYPNRIKAMKQYNKTL